MKNIRRDEGINWVAVDVIGESEPSLTSLKAADTLKELPDEARALKALILSPAAETIIEERTTASRTADKCQKQYKFWGRLAVFLTLVGAAVGVVWIIQDAQTGFDPEVSNWQWLLTFEAGIAALGVLITKKLTTGNFHTRWMRARVASEQARRRYFDFVCTSPELADFNAAQRFRVDLLSLQLEYFRRFQLDLQYNYFKQKARSNRRISRFFKTYWFLAGALGIVTLGVAFPEQLSSNDKVLMFLDQDWIAEGVEHVDTMVWLAIALLLPFAQTALFDWGSIDNSSQNTARYRLMQAHLESYREQLPEIRRAAAMGQGEIVTAFIEQVGDLLSHENAEWSEVHQSGHRPKFDVMHKRHERVLPGSWKSGLRIVEHWGRKGTDWVGLEREEWR